MPTKEELGLVAQSDNTRVLNGRPFSTSSVNTTLYWDPQTQQFEKKFDTTVSTYQNNRVSKRKVSTTSRRLRNHKFKSRNAQITQAPRSTEAITITDPTTGVPITTTYGSSTYANYNKQMTELRARNEALEKGQGQTGAFLTFVGKGLSPSTYLQGISSAYKGEDVKQGIIDAFDPNNTLTGSHAGDLAVDVATLSIPTVLKSVVPKVATKGLLKETAPTVSKEALQDYYSKLQNTQGNVILQQLGNTKEEILQNMQGPSSKEFVKNLKDKLDTLTIEKLRTGEYSKIINKVARQEQLTPYEQNLYDQVNYLKRLRARINSENPALIGVSSDNSTPTKLSVIQDFDRSGSIPSEGEPIINGVGKVTGVHYYDPQLYSDFTKYDFIPRMLRNLKQQYPKITSKQLDEVKQLIENPNIEVFGRYAPKGQGGSYDGTIEFPYGEQAHSDTVYNHEFTHGIRDKISKWLSDNGFIENLEEPFKLQLVKDYNIPKSFINNSEFLDLMPYTPKETSTLQLLDKAGLNFSKKVKQEISPVKEIFTTTSGELRPIFFNKFVKEHGRIPNFETNELERYVSGLSDIDFIKQFEKLNGYSYDILKGSGKSPFIRVNNISKPSFFKSPKEKLKEAREALQRVTFDVAQNTVNQKDYNQGYYAKKGIKLIKKNKQ